MLTDPYVLSMIAIYLIVFTAAMSLPHIRAVLLAGLFWIFAGFLIGPAILAARSNRPEAGLGEAIGDFMLLFMLVVAGALALGVQSLRLTLGRERPGLKAALPVIGLPLCPAVAFGLGLLFFRAAYD